MALGKSHCPLYDKIVGWMFFLWCAAVRLLDSFFSCLKRSLDSVVTNWRGTLFPDLPCHQHVPPRTETAANLRQPVNLVAASPCTKTVPTNCFRVEV